MFFAITLKFVNKFSSNLACGCSS